MTTSITDARYSVLHQTTAHTLSLSFDDPPETGWSVMPGYDESFSIPPYLEPPRIDADETLPSMVHPSYPFGRNVTLCAKSGGWRGKGGVGNLLGTVDGGGWGSLGRGAGSGGGLGGDLGLGGGGRGGLRSEGAMRGGGWDEWGLDEVVEREKRKEVPPGMAGAKRPPTPPSPALRPSLIPSPRSVHLRHLLERQQLAEPQPMGDGFDASVPNETYEDGQQPVQQESREDEQVGRSGEWGDEDDSEGLEGVAEEDEEEDM
ncbi:hypothetical protein IAT38_002825 [Cryptococcus sp. DSM 104549]